MKDGTCKEFDSKTGVCSKVESDLNIDVVWQEREVLELKSLLNDIGLRGGNQIRALTTPSITSISPTSYSMLGGGSMTINVSNIVETEGFRKVSPGGGHTCAIGIDDNVYCWGYNSSGELGNGTTTDSTSPVKVDTTIKFSSISLGGFHSCGLNSSGQAYCWGNNGSGRLGNGSTTDSNVPVQVSSGAIPTGVTLIGISAGSSHTCGLGSDGKGYCWGDGGSGQLGNGSTTASTVPVQVSSGAVPTGVTLSSISAGGGFYSHTCGLGSDGKGYCWGSNSESQLGNGSTTPSNVPVQVSSGAIPSGVTLASINPGGFHTCGLGSDGHAYCWGYNGQGELGNGSGTNSNVPVQVGSGAIPSGITLTGISTAQYHTCGLGSDGHAYCWGGNGEGQLGNGGSIDSNIPVQVGSGAIPSGVTLSSISAGSSHTCGIGSDGQGYCWGSNGNGQLGNMETTNRSTPSYVLKKDIPTIEFGTTPVSSTTYTSTSSMSVVSPSLSTTGAVTVKLTNPDGQFTTYDITVKSIPTEPRNLIATAGDSQVSLAWSAPTSDGGAIITDYVVQYSTNGIIWSIFNDGVSTDTSTTVTGLTNGQQYHFRVVAVNSAGQGQYSSNVIATPIIQSPILPTNVTSVTNNALLPTRSKQWINREFVASGVGPTIVNVVLNEGNAIDLEESTTKAVRITATVVSASTCSSVTSVKAYLYRSGVGYTGCDTFSEANDNHCYPEITCTLNSDSCTDSNSFSSEYTCIANVQYHADPTDSGVKYSSENWLATVSATDSTGFTETGTLSVGVEMNSLVAVGITPSSLEYEDPLSGQSNTFLDRVVTTIPTGNAPINQLHQGDGDGSTAHSYQKYSLSASTPYSSGTSLTNSPVLVPIDIPKATNTNPTGKNTWWGISIPTGTATGQYDGRVFILPVKKEV